MGEDMIKEESIRFLLWTYFKIEGTEKPGKIILAAVKIAYVDATNQGAFNTIEKSGYDEDVKAKAINYLSNAIKNIDKSDKSFNKWHKNTCKHLCAIFKNVIVSDKNAKAFTIGNSQKFVNMTIKYLSILSGISSSSFERWYGSNLKKFEKDYHLPICLYF